MKIVIHDYSCHPFTLEVASYFAKKGHLVNYLFSKQINLTGTYYKEHKHKNLKFTPIIEKKKIKKFNLISRRFIEIEHGNISWKVIKNFQPQLIFFANLPIDPLYFLIKECKKSNFKTVFWVQDIYHLAIKNYFKKIPLIGRLIYKHYQLIEKKCSILSDKNIFISSTFKKFFPINKFKNYTINNWIPLDVIKNYRADCAVEKKLKIESKFTFMYTGTISLKHQYENLILLAISFPDKNIIILSEGKFAEILKKSSKYLKNLRVYPLVSYQELPKYLFYANVTLVNLKDEAADLCVPSKILTYCALSKPILASVPKNSPVNIMILNNNIGLTSIPTDNVSYLDNARLLSENKKLRNKFSHNALKFAKEKFNINFVYKKFDEIIHSIF